MANDIVLLQLDQPINFTQYSYIRPICLPTNLPAIDTNACTATGWGDTAYNGNASNIVLEVNLPVMSNNSCSVYSQFNPNMMVCAGYIQGGKSTCQGDSGGPLNCQTNDGRYVLYGITSFGGICAAPNEPSVFTRVSNYVNDLVAIIKTSGWQK